MTGARGPGSLGFEYVFDTGDGTDELGRVGRAIDDLAEAVAGQRSPQPGQQAPPGSPELTMQELAGRLAAIWQMVAELDPELARRLAAYEG
jgi:hypothetical protein